MLGETFALFELETNHCLLHQDSPPELTLQWQVWQLNRASQTRPCSHIWARLGDELNEWLRRRQELYGLPQKLQGLRLGDELSHAYIPGPGLKMSLACGFGIVPSVGLAFGARILLFVMYGWDGLQRF